MYTNRSEVSGNVSIGNHLGFALMYSDRLIARDNVSINDRDHGIMLNYANYSEISGNVVERGGEKCVFIYQFQSQSVRKKPVRGLPDRRAFHRRFGQQFSSPKMPLSPTETQVKYVGTRWLDWATDGRGNYWSDHTAFDLDGDGIADSAYRPNDMMDQVLVDPPARQALDQQPRRPAAALGTNPVPRPLSRRRHRHISPNGIAGSRCDRVYGSGMMSDGVLSLDNVTKRFGVKTAVDDVTLDLQPGERVALIGHNGAGKTTLFKMILGLTTGQ